MTQQSMPYQTANQNANQNANQRAEPATDQATCTIATTPCPLCDAPASQATPTMKHDRWTLLRCNTCQLVYLDNPASIAELSGEQRWTASYESERAKRRERRPVVTALKDRLRPIQVALRPHKLLALINHELPGGGVVLDIGCGNGHHMARLPSTITPIGIDLDPDGVRVADIAYRARGGRVMLGSAIDELQKLAPGSVDAAIMMAYLEHEPRPLESLRLLHRCLKPNGSIIIKVPNLNSWNRRVTGAKWCGYRFPDHVTYFTPRTLRATIAAAGFGVARFGIRDHFPTSDNMWMVARAK